LPQEVAVSISGMLDNECLQCGDFNGDYICQLNTTFLEHTVVEGRDVYNVKDCEWVYEFPNPVCDINILKVFYHQIFEDPWRLQVSLRRPPISGGGDIIWVKQFDHKPSCYEAQGLDVPLNGYYGAISVVCDAGDASNPGDPANAVVNVKFLRPT